MAEQAESTEAESTEVMEASELDGEIAESDAEPRTSVKEETLEERVEAPTKKYYSSHSKHSKPEKDEERRHDTTDGAVAIIWYRDEKTGKVYFSLEKKSKTHPSKGKYAFYGGTVRVGEPHNESLIRELSEEDPEGYKIVLNALKDNGYKLTELVERVDGRTSRTSVYVAEIKGAGNWDKYMSTKTTEGDKAILSFGEVVAAINGNSFAYPPQADALEMMLKTEFQKDTYTASNHYYSFFKTSAMPCTTTYTTSPFKAQNVKLGIINKPFY